MDLARLVWVFNTLPLIVVQCRVYEKRKLIGDKTMNSVIGLKGRAHNYPLLSPTKMISKLLINYNNQEPPMKDRPTEVQLGIYVNSFYSISEQTMDYSVSMYLRQRWRDPRLTFSPVYRKTFELRLGDDHVNHVWLPDTFFRNEKRATFHEVTVKNRLMRLNATGHIWYVTKISATLSCPMRLHKYPLDTQSCPMMFESFGYTMDTLYYTWLESPVDIEKNVQLPQFTLQRYIQHDCSQNYTAGAFPCLEIRFILRRDVGYFLIQVYLPSMLIVILSWVSFWINVEASPARVSIGLLTVLTTTTQSTQTAAALPRVSYVKAIDIWMSVCLVFVFAALLEYAVVNVLSRRRVVRRTINNTSTNAASANAAAAAAATSGCSAKRPHLLPVRKLDLRAQLDQTTVVAGVDRRSSQHQQQQLQHQQQLQPLHPQQHHHQQYQSISTRNNAPKPPPDDATGTAVSSVIAKTRRPTTTTSTGDGIDGKTQARRVDWIARKAFPLTFLLFIIIYWIVCTVPIGLSDDGSDA